MKIKLIPKKSFEKKDVKNIKRAIITAGSILKKYDIPIAKNIEFYNSFKSFIKRVLPEVKNYGFDEKNSKEIIRCALNNGTYGTIDFKNNSIIEMNFNPFTRGKYLLSEFLELIIHESLHLWICKELNKDVNYMKFKFNNLKYTGNKRILQIDEGFAEFVTEVILKKEGAKSMKDRFIKSVNLIPPIYKEKMNILKIKRFDLEFEKLFIIHKKIGLSIFKKKANKIKYKLLREKIDLLKKFAVKELGKSFVR